MPMSHKKVRFAASAPGLLLLAAPIFAIAALAGCDAAPEGKPAAEVVLSDPDAPSPVIKDGIPATAPGFDSVADSPAPVTATAATGEQQVDGTIIDFLCDPNTLVSSADAALPAACELVIRTKSRGDRRMLCDVAPCDAWAARGGLPQGIRGLEAQAWITLIDTFDAAGNPTGRVAKATRLSVIYAAKP